MPETINLGANSSFSQTSTPIDVGEYEVNIENLEKKTSKDGRTEMLQIAYRIRSDVEQKFQNRLVWEVLFKDSERDTTTGGTRLSKYGQNGWFDMQRLSALVEATQPGGVIENLKIDEPDVVLLALKGTNLIITVDKEFDATTGNERNRVKRYSYKKTNHSSGVQKVEPDTTSLQDDLPF